MADPRCWRCRGTGEVTNRYGARVCHCVYRRVFRVCMRRYEQSRSFGGLLCGAGLAQRVSRCQGLSTEPRAYREAAYTADIELTAKRALTGRTMARAIWWYHFMHGCDWQNCIRLIRYQVGLPLDRGNYFHEVYRTEVMLGRVFLEMRPYSLCPQEYFGFYRRTSDE